MPVFKPTNELDRVFLWSIVVKAIDGVLEVVGGVLLLLVSPARITQFAKLVTQHELGTDSHDFIARHILRSAHDFAAGGRMFAAVYLLVHGVTKIVLVVEILREHMWAYKGMVVMLGLFIVYQLYRMLSKPSVSLILLSVFDAIIIVLTLREERRQRGVIEHASTG